MKTTLSLVALCLAMASCSNKEQSQVKSLESVTLMPPDMDMPGKYISLDTSLLALKKDLSCGMSLKKGVADTMTFQGKLYGFCGKGCKEDFATDPLAHINAK